MYNKLIMQKKIETAIKSNNTINNTYRVCNNLNPCNNFNVNPYTMDSR